MAAKKGPINKAKDKVMEYAAPVADVVGNTFSRQGKMARDRVTSMMKQKPEDVPPVTRKEVPTSGNRGTYDDSEGKRPRGYM